MSDDSMSTLRPLDAHTRRAHGVSISDSSRKVLRNTYALLGLTLAFSALVAGTAMTLKLPAPGLIVTLAGFFGLMFWVNKTAHKAQGLLAVFAFTGFLGYTLGPTLSVVLALPQGAAVVTQALATTALAFLGLSAVALTTKRDFSFMGRFLMIGSLVAFALSLGAIFFSIPALSLAVCALVVMLMSGMILFETSRIVNGGETNYILATVSLYLSLYNLFSALLALFGMGGRDE